MDSDLDKEQKQGKITPFFDVHAECQRNDEHKYIEDYRKSKECSVLEHSYAKSTGFDL
jgi:hypothetical protein